MSGRSPKRAAETGRYVSKKARETSRAAVVGRQAKTRGVSLRPDEAELVDVLQREAGIGLTEQVRRLVLPKLPAAIALIRDAKASGMQLAAVAVEQVVYVESAEERRALREDTFTSEASEVAVAH